MGVSTEIMLEYEETLSVKTSPTVAVNVMKMLVNLANVSNNNIHFNWGLITVDADDNKFVDCAIAFKADYVVTEDKHFNVLKSIVFPKLNVVDADAFLIILQNQ